MASAFELDGRVEPRFGPEVPARDVTLDLGLEESDRIMPSRRTRRPPPRNARRKGGGRGGRRGAGGRRRDARAPGLIRRFFGRLVYWSAVAAIIVAGTGVAAVYYFASDLPSADKWTVPARAANVRVLAADGSLISNRGDTVGVPLRLDEMPDHLPQAVMAIEDRRFYWHFGLDPVGLTRAMVANIRAGRVVQGGSTLTQQLAKNLFLKPDRTIARKAQEVILAVWLEARLTKQEILELYLNRVYLGAGAFGVDAAAHRYFGKSARDITLAEAATLAGMLKAPATYSPVAHPEAAARRTGTVLMAMHDAGFISSRETSLALSADTVAVGDVAEGSGRYVVDWVLDQLPGYVGTPGTDIVVETTIDPAMQDAAARAVSGALREFGEEKGVSQGALVAIDTGGAVRALVGGRSYSRSPYNRAVSARRQPGSAFKPFVYLTALEYGLHPESVRIDQPVSIRGWRPENYTKEFRGPVSLTTALALSINTVSAQLTAEFGPRAVAATARRLGVSSPLMETPSIALGTSEVSPLELTAAFVPFSNGGRGVIPHVIARITTAGGDPLYQRNGSGPGQVIDPYYVGLMNGMLAETILSGTGRRAQLAGWPAAGKTGTSQEFRDAWFVGYTGMLTAGAWFGNDDATPTKRASGGNVPAVAWQRFMTEALEGYAVVGLPGGFGVGPEITGSVVPAAPGIVGPSPLPQGVTESDGAPMVLVPQAGEGFDTSPAPSRWRAEGAPVPPAAIGSPPARSRGGLFSRLFGG